MDDVVFLINGRRVTVDVHDAQSDSVDMPWQWKASAAHYGCFYSARGDEPEEAVERLAELVRGEGFVVERRSDVDDTIDVKVRRLRDGARIPTRGSAQAAGWDLYALLDGADLRNYVVINPGETKLIGTGISVQIPDGYEGQIRSRSGLAAKRGLIVLNSPGTIDADYRGELVVIVHNTGDTTRSINQGDRIAQLVIKQVPRVTLTEAAELDETERGAGGFGSTGV